MLQRRELLRLIRFALSGAGILAVAFGLNWVLVAAGAAKPVAYAATMAVQLVLGYAANQLVVFREQRSSSRLVVSYLAVASGFRAADWLLYVTLVHLTPIPFQAIQLGNAVLFQLLKYVVYRRMFTTDRNAGGPPPAEEVKTTKPDHASQQTP